MGLQKLTVQEAVNAKLGQGGFDLYHSGATPDNVTGSWVALMCISTGSTGVISVHAETRTGSNLSDDGSTGEVTLSDSNIIYGPFNKLVSATIGAGEVLIAYRG